ncbi:hypothetical protein LMH87_009463 [Akanthomyces muscarius]|uniref:Uncharacterized protein n=1 Tax=Akanthomyces muscarius TaxID=2231603 RepID=A0A9W8QDZ3_AKAMU|nr:hypothetical protein LMH87_009463 [Akanthomyces muscarius]KAJ4152946.1 hypothetical protein LMH87_009463 [Akanthomyces muscarius]
MILPCKSPPDQKTPAGIPYKLGFEALPICSNINPRGDELCNASLHRQGTKALTSTEVPRPFGQLVQVSDRARIKKFFFFH